MAESEKSRSGNLPPPEVSFSDRDPLVDHRNDIFFAAIQTTRMPMLVTDPRQPDNPIIFANPAFLWMTGYTVAELIGRNCRFLQGPETDRSTIAAIRDAVAAAREINVEILNYRKDGTSFWNALFISPVFDHQQQLVYFFASQLDVSRRRDAEAALGQAQKMEALGQLTGGISHDFNNLLQVISGHLDILSMRAKTGKLDAAALTKSIDTMRGASDRAQTLTQQMLAFSRRQRLQGRVVNLNYVVGRGHEAIESRLGSTIVWRAELDPNLANCSLDPSQLDSALANILANARDAMPEQGTLTIRTENVVVEPEDRHAFAGLKAGRYVTLSVTDSGAGIPEDIVGRVMDPFFTTKEEGKGTGLGLSMVYGFAKQSGGIATIYSEPGVGTTVRMYFPAAQSEIPEPDAELPVADRGGSESILVVDDRREVAEMARDLLTGLGYQVRVAGGGREALEIMRSLGPTGAPDLLFSDIIMPGDLNGFALAREIRRMVPGIRVLLTTGFAGTGDEDRSDDGHEFQVLNKPYRLSDLARRVRMVLDGPRGGGA